MTTVLDQGIADIATCTQQTERPTPSGDTGDYCRARAKLDPASQTLPDHLPHRTETHLPNTQNTSCAHQNASKQPAVVAHILLVATALVPRPSSAATMRVKTPNATLLLMAAFADGRHGVDTRGLHGICCDIAADWMGRDYQPPGVADDGASAGTSDRTLQADRRLVIHFTSSALTFSHPRRSRTLSFAIRDSGMR